MFDKGIGSINDRLCRTVVALQLKEFGILIALLELQDIAYIRAPERIDTLCIITNNTNSVFRFCQYPNHQILSVISILILINKDILKTLLIARPYLLILPQ